MNRHVTPTETRAGIHEIHTVVVHARTNSMLQVPLPRTYTHVEAQGKCDYDAF